MIWSPNQPLLTLEDLERFHRLREMGCILTMLRGLPARHAEIHHLLIGHRRQSHQYTIPLTKWYHRGVCLPGCTAAAMRREYGPSIVHGSKAFFAGHRVTEHDLWKLTQEKLGLPTDMPLSKIVRRLVQELTDVTD